MAHTCVEVAAVPEAVFDVLLDPRTYPSWLVGADEIRAVDDAWPQPGARFHHTVGIWPVHIHDRTELVAIDRPRMLRLSVRATALVRATVTITVRGDERSSIVCMEEEPAHRVIGRVVRPVLDPATHLRNHASLRRLAALVQERTSAV
ncbi:MAG TPA: SRPBCC family protein [Acidimicrobiales bacterium]|nr:SRPBCC family protein [Acidimicrobiales bacterium]